MTAAGTMTAATDAQGETVGAEWHAILCVEGVRTDDGRELMPGACRFPDLPVSLRLLIEDEGGHWGAVTCGRIDTMERQEFGGLSAIYGTGVFGSDANGQLGETLVREQTQRFISIDPRDVTAEWIEIEVRSEESGGLFGDDEDGGAVLDCWLRCTDLVIGGATVVSMPALQQAVICLATEALPEAPIATEGAPPSLPANLDPRAPVVAAGAPVQPPREWFADPGFVPGDDRLVLQEDGRSYACPLTVTDEGQVFGHIAWWNCRHTGFPGRDVRPPHSRSAYAHFLTAPGVECDDGSVVEGTGVVTMGCGHASTRLGYRDAVAHYDGGYGATQVADVRAGEDQFGPWIAGALRPGLSPEQLREFRALSLSGDWREIGSHLDLIAVLAVPVPGFPIRRGALAASAAEVIDLAAVRAGLAGERVVSLVAAGRVVRLAPEVRLERMERRLMALAETVSDLRRAEVGRIQARLGA